MRLVLFLILIFLQCLTQSAFRIHIELSHNSYHSGEYSMAHLMILESCYILYSTLWYIILCVYVVSCTWRFLFKIASQKVTESIFSPDETPRRRQEPLRSPSMSFILEEENQGEPSEKILQEVMREIDSKNIQTKKDN